MTTHLVIPDVQAKAGVPLDHLDWIAKLILDEKPDVIVCIGDFADMPSLSMYDVGKASAEGRRYRDDIKAAHDAMDRLVGPLHAYNIKRRQFKEKTYNPRMVMTLGNHEHRIVRAADNDPKFASTIDLDDLQYKESGWEVHPFLEVVVIDGIAYSHFHATGVMGRPASSARIMVAKKHMSCTMGHVQHTDIDMTQTRADGQPLIGLFCGVCYLHNEPYLGPQGNNVRRQVVIKRNVSDGNYEPEFISLETLRKRYA